MTDPTNRPLLRNPLNALADPERLTALHRTGLLDTGPEEAFDRYSRLAARLLGVPTVLVSLVDLDRQFFKSCVGLREPYATARQTPLSHSFCQYTVVERSPLIVRDARSDPILANNGAVADLGVVAYAGVPLVTHDGHVLGSFCAIDGAPREWSQDDLATLQDLASGVVTEIALREATVEARQLLTNLERDRAEIAALLDSTAEGIYGIDVEGRCSFVNASATRLLGYEAAELLGKNMHQTIHHTKTDGSAYPEEECPVRRAVRRGQGVRRGTEALWRRDGSSFPAEYSAQPVIRQGRTTGAVVTFVDITERLAGEQRLAVQYAVASTLALSNDWERAAPQLLETIGSGLGWDVGLLWQVQGDALSCDHAWQVPGAGVDEFIHASRDARVESGHGLVGSVWQTRELVWVADLKLEPRFDRARAAWSANIGGAFAFPILSGGQVLGVIELLSHARRPADPELLQTLASLGYQIGQFMSRVRAEDWLRIATRAIDSASSGIVISNAEAPDMPIVYANPGFTSMTGYAAEEVIGRNCRFLQGYETDPAEVARLRDAIAQRTQCCAVLLNYRADGTTFWNDLTISPVVDASGTVSHYIGIQVDVTSRKRIEQDLQEARKAAEAANQAKSRFLANMSHELRTPLNAVILYSELLQEEAQDLGVPQFVPDLEKIRAAGRHLLSLINTVLDLAKVEAGKTELHLETFDVAEVIRDVVATTVPLVEKNRNVLEVQVAPDIGSMRADVVKLRQILFNFLSNAAKFTEDGRVVLSALREEAAGGTIELRVRDTGIGMSPEQMARLFQPFTQADESITRRYGGSGLGLALSAELAQLMGGTVAISSEPGAGTDICVRLPVDGAAGDAPVGGDLPMDGYALIIDDEPASRAELLAALADHGVPAATAVDGLDGLRLARKFRPSIIFLDVIMPLIDGWEVLAALKADPELAGVPVVMVTLSPTEDLGYLLGAADFLMKPLDQSRLVEVLRRLGPQGPPGGVLIIDDDAATRAVARKLLEREGWNVEEAEHGRAGLQRLAQTGISLVILDLIMPEMDGFEFLARLRREPAWRNLPVVVMTSKDLTQKDRARLAGTVHSIITKGASTREDVLRQVREIAGRNVLRPSGNRPDGPPIQSEE